MFSEGVKHHETLRNICPSETHGFPTLEDSLPSFTGKQLFPRPLSNFIEDNKIAATWLEPDDVRWYGDGEA